MKRRTVNLVFFLWNSMQMAKHILVYLWIHLGDFIKETATKTNALTIITGLGGMIFRVRRSLWKPRESWGLCKLFMAFSILNHFHLGFIFSWYLFAMSGFGNLKLVPFLSLGPPGRKRKPPPLTFFKLFCLEWSF